MQPLIALHAGLAAVSVLVGAAVLMRRKGTRSHKLLGRLWVAAMVGVAVSSFWIFEIRRGASLALAVWFIRRGNVRAHQGFMAGTFAGLAIAELLAGGRHLL